MTLITPSGLALYSAMSFSTWSSGMGVLMLFLTSAVMFFTDHDSRSASVLPEKSANTLMKSSC